jgi:hypothetical protein
MWLLWAETKQKVSNLDELAMSRLRLQFDDTPPSRGSPAAAALASRATIARGSEDELLAEFNAQLADATVDLARAESRFNYRKSLIERREESCPICLSAMAARRGVLPCGHSMCLLCFETVTAKKTLVKVTFNSLGSANRLVVSCLSRRQLQGQRHRRRRRRAGRGGACADSGRRCWQLEL